MFLKKNRSRIIWNDEDDDDEGLPRTQVSEGEDKATVFSRCKMGLAKQVSPKKT